MTARMAELGHDAGDREVLAPRNAVLETGACADAGPIGSEVLVALTTPMEAINRALLQLEE